MQIEIRDAVPTDRTTIAEFNSRLSAETEDAPLDDDIIAPGVTAVLEDAGKGRYWVATDGDRVIGQIMVTYEWSDWRNGMLWWIQSVYVHTDYRRQGIFSKLYRHVETLARGDETVAGIRLYVEQDNERAQSTYDKLGMRMTSYQVMQSLFEKNRGEQE